MTLDIFQLSVEVIGLLMLVVFGYYAAMILASFRRGMLQRGWMQVTIGAILLVSAQLTILASGVGPSELNSKLDVTGDFMRFVSLIFLTLGLRAHYRVWHLDRKKIAATSPFSDSITP